MTIDDPADPSGPGDSRPGDGRPDFTGGSASREPFTTPFGPDGGRPELDTFRTAPDFGEPARAPGEPDTPSPNDPGQSSGAPDPLTHFQLEAARLRTENESLRHRVAELEAEVERLQGRPGEG